MTGRRSSNYLSIYSHSLIQIHNKNTIIKYICARINNVAHITRKNINSRNIFIKKNIKMTMRILQENSQNV